MTGLAMLLAEVVTMFGLYGLGKQRSRFGRWMDRQGITQLQLEKESGLSRGTISRICNDADYRPKVSTVAKVKRAIKALGYDVPPDDYFG